MPEARLYGDIKELTYGKLKSDGIGSIDVVCGGFPCQDISTCRGGEAEGIKGSRSGLWSELHRLIEETHPKYAIVENVSALRGRGFAVVLQDLAKIGYDAEWHCIPAGAIGARHRRDRIWIVAYPKRERIQQRGSDQEACGELRDEGGSFGDEREQGECDEETLADSGGGGQREGADESCDGEEGDRSSEGEEAQVESGAPVSRESTGGSGTGGTEDVADGEGVSGQRPESIGDRPRESEMSLGDGGHRPLFDKEILKSCAERWAHSVWSPAVESGILRVSDGVPDRVDRIRAMGNAIVPQMAEYIGLCILKQINDEILWMKKTA
jgi:DNA (cytosine-5)-methyltransferase 1